MIYKTIYFAHSVASTITTPIVLTPGRKRYVGCHVSLIAAANATPSIAQAIVATTSAASFAALPTGEQQSDQVLAMLLLANSTSNGTTQALVSFPPRPIIIDAFLWLHSSLSAGAPFQFAYTLFLE